MRAVVFVSLFLASQLTPVAYAQGPTVEIASRNQKIRAILLKPEKPVASVILLAGGHGKLDLAANGAGGLGSVEVQNLTLGQTAFTPVPGLQDVPLGLDPSASDARNSALWDALFLHFEGATYMLDNIEVGRAGFARSYGSGCAAGAGNATLSAQGQLQAGGVLQLESSGHAPGQPGVLLLGLSDASYLGLPLPLALDPLLGTSGCSLFTSIEATASGISSASSPAVLSFAFGVPSPSFSARLYAQTLSVAPVPGGLALSNGLLLQLR